MGAYAAILFGHMIQADLVIAIAPQTFIDEEQRQRYDDTRWNVLMRKFHLKIKNSPYYDLAEYLKSKKTETVSLLFYGSSDRLDTLHSTRMENLNNFFIYEVKDADHVSAQIMRDYGIIDRLLDIVLRERNAQLVAKMLETESMLKKYTTN